MWQEHSYLIDPHTAVAFDVLDQYRAETGDTTPALVVSTASPFKFCDSVLGALGVTRAGRRAPAFWTSCSQVTGVPAPAPLAGLKDKTVRFAQSVTEKEHMVDQVLEMLTMNGALRNRATPTSPWRCDKPMDVFGGGWDGLCGQAAGGLCSGSGRRTPWCCAATCPGA